MSIEAIGVIVTIIAAMAGFIGGYAVLRSRVSRLADDFKEHIKENDEKAKAVHDRINAGFKRMDDVTAKVIVLQRDTATHMDLPTAELKFVTRRELELHLDKIEIITDNTNQQVTLLMGKQDEILSILNGDRI